MSTEEKDMAGDGAGRKQGKRAGFPWVQFVLLEAAVVAVWFAVVTFKGPWAWVEPAALGVLFAALACVALLFGLQTQNEEFALQRNELGLQREELALQRESLAVQRDELAVQRESLEATREEFRRMAVANAETAELGRKNVRAQYLMFWIGKNSEAFGGARRVYDEALAGARLIERQLLHYQDIDTPLKRVLADELDKAKAIMADKQKILDPYVRYEAELDQITRELNRPITPICSPFEYRAEVEASMGIPAVLLPPEE